MPTALRPMRPLRASSVRSASEAGFSLVEGLIAALLLLVIVVGLLPLFSRSMMNNMQGSDAMNATNSVVGEFERYLALPFDREELTIPVGSTEIQSTNYFLMEGRKWDASVPGTDQARWQRDATVRQFSIGDLFDNGTLDNALPGDATPSFVHLKTIEVSIQNGRSPGAPTYDVRVLQVF